MEYRYEIQGKSQKTEEGYSVWVPGLPDCWSQGKTKSEELENITDAAIQAYLETMEALTKDNESRYKANILL